MEKFFVKKFLIDKKNLSFFQNNQREIFYNLKSVVLLLLITKIKICRNVSNKINFFKDLQNELNKKIYIILLFRN